MTMADDPPEAPAVAVGGAGLAAAGAAAAVGDDAPTQLLDTAAGGTREMPVVLVPEAEPEPESSGATSAVGALAAGLWARRALLAIVGGIALVVVVLGLALGGDDLDVPPASTVPVTAEPTTTVAPTTTSPPTTESPPAEGRGEGRGKGKKGED